MRKKWLSISLVTLLALILIGIKVYQTHPEYFPEFKSTAGQNEVDETSGIDWEAQKEFEEEQKDLPSKKHRSGLVEDTFPFTTVEQKKFAEKYPEKFSIVEKMYYAMDYIDNAEGEVETVYPIRGSKTQFSFHVDLVNQKYLGQVKNYQDGKIVEVKRSLSKNGVEIRSLPEKHIYTNRNDKDGSNSLALILFSDSVTSILGWDRIYDKYPNWEYTESTKFGMPVYQIEGTREGIEGKQRFTMTVAKNTGVLLNFKEYEKDNKDKLGYSIIVKNIKINQGISDNVFQLDVSNDKEVSFDAFN